MSEYVLTADEVLYLAASTGADSFYGVPDRLTGLSDQELKMRLIQIEDALGRKGYLKTDFDGNSRADVDLLQLIDVCADYDSLLCLEAEVPGEPQKGALYFIREGEAAAMTRRDEEYVFEDILRQNIPERILSGILWRETEPGGETEFHISQRELTKASKLAERGAADKSKELLVKAGANEAVADTILSGMQRQADFYSLFFLNSYKEEQGVSVQFLQGKILAAMQHDMENDEDYIRFRCSGREELEDLIAKGFEKLGLSLGKTGEERTDFE